MIIPGWLPAQFTPPVDHPIPEPLVVNYYDKLKSGRVSALVTLQYGSPLVVNRSGFRLIDIDIQIRNVFDVALLDRIE